MSNVTDNLAVWRAQLADMPLKTILDYLRERGWEPRSAIGWDVDRLPLEYLGRAPLADDDVPVEERG